MKNKWIAPFLTLCVGILIGWFSGRIGLRLVPVLEGEAPTSHTPPEPQRPREPQYASSVPSVPSVPTTTDPDDSESPETRHGILMQQSAEETRQAIIENANLDETQTAQLDILIANMNNQMLEVSTKWADHIRATDTLDINTRLKMQHEINGVSVSFSDTMDEEFPGWRANDTDVSRLIRVTVAFEPFRKVRGEILRGEMNTRRNNETEGNE